MTTKLDIIAQENLTQLTNDELVGAHREAKAHLERYKRQVGFMELEMHQRMDAVGSRALADGNGEILVTRRPPAPEYDQNLLVPLREVLTHEAFGESYVTKTTESWNMTKLKKWAGLLGKPVQDIMDRALLPVTRVGKLEFPEEK